jgi:hypothetical protein
MHHRIAAGFALGLLAIAASSVDAQFKGKGGDVSRAQYGWLSSLQEGKAQTNKSGKPMMVVIRCVP